MSRQTDIDALESIVDKVGIAETIRMVGEVCREKADHIRQSYDDDELADAWDTAADDIENLDLNDVE